MKKTRKVLALVIVLLMVLSSYALSASAVVHNYELELYESEYVLLEAYETVTYEFTPSKDGWYTFFSESYAGNDPYATLYDSEDEWLDSSDDFYDGDNYDFRIIAKLYAGETYFLTVGSYVGGEDTCETYITVEEVDVPVYAEVVTYPENREVVEGYEADSAEVDSIEILYHFEDGTTYLWSFEEGSDVNGLFVYCYDDFSEDGKEYYLDFECADTVARVKYDITENPIESIKVTELPTLQEYEFYYYPLWEGTEVTINLKDGGKIVKVLKEDDISCRVNYPEFYFEAEGYEVTINYYYDEDMMQECYIFSCLGREYCVNDLIFTDAKEVTELKASKLTETGEGAVVDVKYANGEKETFAFDVVDYYWDYYYDEDMELYVEYISGLTETKHGYAYYSLTPVHDKDGYLLGYELWFLGGTAFIDPDDIEELPGDDLLLTGDADENGIVNIKDATAIQKATAGIITLGELGELQADVDDNGVVNVKDATAIQKWLAGIETGLLIGEYI